MSKLTSIASCLVLLALPTDYASASWIGLDQRYNVHAQEYWQNGKPFFLIFNGNDREIGLLIGAILTEERTTAMSVGPVEVPAHSVVCFEVPKSTERTFGTFYFRPGEHKPWPFWFRLGDMWMPRRGPESKAQTLIVQSSLDETGGRVIHCEVDKLVHESGSRGTLKFVFRRTQGVVTLRKPRTEGRGLLTFEFAKITSKTLKLTREDDERYYYDLNKAGEAPDGHELLVEVAFPKVAHATIGTVECSCDLARERDMYSLKLGLVVTPPQGPLKLTKEYIDAAWSNLTRKDEAGLRLAMDLMIAAPVDFVPFLREKIKPVSICDKQVLSRLIKDLDSDTFDTRKKALAELERLGESSAGVIEEALNRDPSANLKAQLLPLRDKREIYYRSSEFLRLELALVVLARMENAEAKNLLATIAQGAQGARQSMLAWNGFKYYLRKEYRQGSFFERAKWILAHPVDHDRLGWTPDEWKQGWADLADKQAKVRARAMEELLTDPSETVSYLKSRLSPVATPDPARLEALIEELLSDKPNKWGTFDELRFLREVGAAAVKKHIKGKKLTEEQTNWIASLLRVISKELPLTEHGRISRAIDVLERIDSAESRALLESLAKGCPDAHQTKWAKAALERLAKAKDGKP